MSAIGDVDVAVIGGGPAGATAATEIARTGRSVLLIDGSDRIKPCGGAIPPLLLAEFDVPDHLVTARVGGARITAPSTTRIDMAIGSGYVGMVDRETFDPWLRDRAGRAGAHVLAARFRSLHSDGNGSVINLSGPEGRTQSVRCRLVIGADGANSAVRRAAFGPAARPPYVFAYHEIVEAPNSPTAGYDPVRCDVHYDGAISPDFYGWVFPHGPRASVGVGSGVKGFDFRKATELLRLRSGLAFSPTLRAEGAPLPLRPLRRWDDGRNVILVGDAAGCVAPASGEGIYYAMLSGRFAAEAAAAFLDRSDPRALSQPRARFMRRHGLTFLILGMMQGFWYRNDRRRERFAAICADRDVQRLTWESYLDKRITFRDPAAHVRIVYKDIVHMLGLAVR